MHVHGPPPQMPGFLIPNQDAQPLKQQVAEILERDHLRFPGAQPVSFAREHIAELQRKEYFMCEKTDGLRCLLFLHWRDTGHSVEPLTILIDRKNNYYDVQPPLRFPYYQDFKNAEQFLFGTILDGELVHDTYENEPKPRLIYYVFDCLAIDNQNMTGRSLDKRLGRVKEWIFKPYHQWHQHHQRNPNPEPFLVKEKAVYPPYHVKNMFEHVLPGLRHGNDGLIFTCKNTRYEFGTDKHILKWKPPIENTIDFKLRLGEFPLFDPEDGEEGLIPDYDAMPDSFTLLVQHNANNYKPFATLHVTPEEWEKLKGLNQRLDGRIIECYRAPSGVWKYKPEADGTPRWRDDKKDANHISTVNSVLESIEDPVTEQDLINVESRVREAVYRLREEEKIAHRQQQQQPGQQQSQQWHGDQERDPKKRKFSETGLNGGP